MAGTISVLPVVRPRIGIVSSSLTGRRIVYARGLSYCAVPVWQGKRRRSVRCACSEEYDTKSVEKLSTVTLYDLLGISRQVGISEIKTAYRERARRYHPDANPPSEKDECTKKFLQVQEAYEVLADPDLRADYDYRLRHPMSMQALTTGLVHKGRRHRRRDEEDVVNKEAWKSQWEAQVDGLRKDLGRKKPGSWAAMMQQRRREEAAQREARDQNSQQ